MSRLRIPARALRDVFQNPDLGRIQLAWAGFSFTMWSFAIALGVYAFESAGAAAVGIAGLVRVLPGAIASPFGGLLGDHYPRRSVLVWSTLACAIALGAAALAVAAEAPTWTAFVLGGVFTAFAAPYIPAQSALQPQLARTPQELSAANVAWSIMDNVGFLGGSLLTGVVLALSSVQAVFALSALAALASMVVLLRIAPDRRPDYTDGEDAGTVVERTAAGFSTLLADPPLRLLGACDVLLAFVEGAADVLVVLVALDLLGLGNSSAAFINAAWGVGALAGGAALAVLMNRGYLVAGLVVGSLVIGVTFVLPALWPAVVAAVAAWIGVGFGYTFVEVASNTLFQRLGDDEVLARVRGSIESGRLLGMALGAFAVTPLVELLGIREAVIIIAAVMPVFVLLRWSRLRAYEVGAPVIEHHFALLRADSIFAPLSLATLERLAHDLVEVQAAPGQEVITQGDPGDRFYLIEEGSVEVVANGEHRRYQGAGGSFGEIALLRNEPRTATVRAVEQTRLLALDRDRFIAAVTGHQRSSQAAHSVIDDRLTAAGGDSDGRPG
jgi:MFS family permease